MSSQPEAALALSDSCPADGGCGCREKGAAVAAFETARGAGCTITTKDASVQLRRAESLRSHVTGIERQQGSLTVSFDGALPSGTLDEFVETEKGCCGFLSIQREKSRETTLFVFASDDPERQPALDVIARTLDPAQTPVQGESGERGKRAAMIGALGLACLACCLPPLLAAGVVGSLVATFGGTAGIAAGLSLFLALAAIIVFARRRRQIGEDGCGC